MPQEGDGIMALLNQGDPQGAFLAKMFSEGKLPGDPGANLNMVLNMLSPGAVAERQASGMGVGDLSQQLNLDPTETENFIRNQLGLQLTPAQEGTLGVKRNEAMVNALQAMLENEMANKEFGLKKRETVVKETKEEREGRESDSLLEERGARKGALDATAEAARALAETRQFTTSLRKAMRTGIDERGAPIDPGEMQRIRGLLQFSSTNPQMMTMAGMLLRTGFPEDRDAAVQILNRETGQDFSALESKGFLDGLLFKLGYKGAVKSEDELLGIEEAGRRDNEEFRKGLQDLLVPQEQ